MLFSKWISGKNIPPPRQTIHPQIKNALNQKHKWGGDPNSIEETVYEIECLRHAIRADCVRRSQVVIFYSPVKPEP